MQIPGYWSAPNNPSRGVPTDDLTGSFLIVDHMKRFTLNTSAADCVIMLAMPTYTRLIMTRMHPGNSSGTIDFPFYDWTQPQPSSIRCQRQSIRLRNTTTADEINGSVRVCRVDTKIGLTGWQHIPTVADAAANKAAANTMTITQALIDQLTTVRDTHKNAATFPAHHFTQNREYSSLPAHASAYKEYEVFGHDLDWATSEGKTNDINHRIAQGETKMAMETIVIFFEKTNTATDNTYDLTVYAQDAVNYPTGGLLHSLQSKPDGARA